ncbi:MAG: hypothetical protein ACR2K2_05675, partial [Mycobacteriales bacterium]
DRDTKPVPVAVTLTRLDRRLLFTYGVPSCLVFLDLRKPNFPIPDRHFRAFSRSVADLYMKYRG